METLFTLVPLIVFLPVLGLLFNIAFGSRLGEKAIGTVASAASGLAFVVSVLLGIALASTGGDVHVVPLPSGSALAASTSPGTSAWTPSR